MVKTEIIVSFSSPIENVWEFVTSMDATWRSDLAKIECLSDTSFCEHSVDGYVTEFHIQSKEECKRYEFTLENTNMTGHWLGLFEREEAGCRIHFIEEINVKKVIMKPFATKYLKKQQALYVEDLKKALHEE